MSTISKQISTWAMRVLFVILALAFGLWGIADVVRTLGGSADDVVARVGDQRIQLADLQHQVSRALPAAMRQTGATEVSPALRQAVAQQALEQLISLAAIQNEAKRLGVRVPDQSVRAAITDLPVFRGPDGAFDRTRFTAVLRDNALSEAQLVRLIRDDIASRQLLEPVRAGASEPKLLAERIYAAQHETRVADLATAPFAAQPPPPDPGDTVLQRYYDNHPDAFATPEMRHIRAVLLTAESVAKTLDVSDADIAADYQANQARYWQPERRSVRIVTLDTEEAARDIAQAWRTGADWDRVQALAKAAAGSALDLDEVTRAELPVPALAETVFTSTVGSVVTLAADGKWDVVAVVAITPASSPSLADLHDTVRTKIATLRAGEQLAERARQVEDVFATGVGLQDKLPEVGLEAVTGSLDAAGNTADRKPAPLPAPPELRDALIAAAFRADLNQPPHLLPVALAGGGQGYYAVTVDQITPEGKTPFADARAKALADWQRAAQRHVAEQRAAGLLAACDTGTPLAVASRAAGLAVTRSAPVSPGQTPSDIPAPVLARLFALTPGKATMAETETGFVVAVLVSAVPGDPARDPAGVDGLREQLARAAADDMELTLVNGLRNRLRPSVNRDLLSKEEP